MPQAKIIIIEKISNEKDTDLANQIAEKLYFKYDKTSRIARSYEEAIKCLNRYLYTDDYIILNLYLDEYLESILFPTSYEVYDLKNIAGNIVQSLEDTKNKA